MSISGHFYAAAQQGPLWLLLIPTQAEPCEGAHLSCSCEGHCEAQQSNDNFSSSMFGTKQEWEHIIHNKIPFINGDCG